MPPYINFIYKQVKILSVTYKTLQDTFSLQLHHQDGSGRLSLLPILQKKAPVASKSLLSVDLLSFHCFCTKFMTSARMIFRKPLMKSAISAWSCPDNRKNDEDVYSPRTILIIVNQSRLNSTQRLTSFENSTTWLFHQVFNLYTIIQCTLE